MLGLDLVVNAYPGPGVIRDKAQVRLLQGMRERLGNDWTWRYEVPVLSGDQRAWDARARHRHTHLEFVVEAETRIHDIQALLRRLALKRDAGGIPRLVLLVAGTHHNRDAIKVGGEPLASEFPATTRTTLMHLAQGIDPGADGLVILAPA